MKVEKEEKEGAFPEFTITLTNNGSEVADGLHFFAQPGSPQDINGKNVGSSWYLQAEEDVFKSSFIGQKDLKVGGTWSAPLKNLAPGASSEIKIRFHDAVVHGTIMVVLKDLAMNKILDRKLLTTETANGLTFKVRDIKPERNEDKTWKFKYTLEIINHTDEVIDLQGINIALNFPEIMEKIDLPITEPTLVQPCRIFTYTCGITLIDTNKDLELIKESHDGSLIVTRGNETLADVAQKDVKVLLKTPASDRHMGLKVLPALQDTKNNTLTVQIDLKNLTQEVINLDGIKVSYVLKSMNQNSTFLPCNDNILFFPRILDKDCATPIKYRPIALGKSMTKEWLDGQELQLEITATNKQGQKIGQETKALEILCPAANNNQ